MSRATRADAADSSAGPRHLPSRAEKSAFSLQASTTIIMIVRIMPEENKFFPFHLFKSGGWKKVFPDSTSVGAPHMSHLTSAFTPRNRCSEKGV